MSDDELAAVQAATAKVVAAVQTSDAGGARAALMDSGTVEKGLWYRYIVSDLLELVRCHFDLGPDTGAAHIAELLGPPLPDGPRLRSKVAAVTGREMSVEETRKTVDLGAAATASAQHLLAEYLRLEVDHGPAQQQRFLAALDGLIAEPQQYVAVAVMLAKAVNSGAVDSPA